MTLDEIGQITKTSKLKPTLVSTGMKCHMEDNQYLEKTVLTTSFLEQLVNEYGIKLIKVDLTNKHSEAEALLRALGSVSIPVTAIFPSGEKANQPLVLRDVYTSEQLEKALQLAIKSSE